jgi:hypothetical protein
MLPCAPYGDDHCECAKQARVCAGDLSAVPAGCPSGEGRDLGRVLQGDWVSSKACHPRADWAGARGGAPRQASARDLQHGGDRGAAGDLGSRGLSVVAAAARPAAAVAALGASAPAAAAGGGGAAARHQPAPDGSPAGAPSPPTHQAAVRPDQARDPAQTPHPAEDGSLGCPGPRLHRDRSRRSLRQLRGGRIRALAQPDGHPHHLGGDSGRARQESARGPGGAGGTPPGPAVPAAGHRFGQRVGVHQSASLGLLPGPGGPVHARTAVQEGRQRAHRAEELDPCPQAPGLRALRQPRRAGRYPRSLPPRAAPVPELLPAFRQAAPQGAGRRARPASLRGPADAAGAGARLRRSPPRGRRPAPASTRRTRSLRARPRHRAATRAHLRAPIRRQGDDRQPALGSDRDAARVAGRQDLWLTRCPSPQGPRDPLASARAAHSRFPRCVRREPRGRRARPARASGRAWARSLASRSWRRPDLERG